jgi:hypothetical protein
MNKAVRDRLLKFAIGIIPVISGKQVFIAGVDTTLFRYFWKASDVKYARKVFLLFSDLYCFYKDHGINSVSRSYLTERKSLRALSRAIKSRLSEGSKS